MFKMFPYNPRVKNTASANFNMKILQPTVDDVLFQLYRRLFIRIHYTDHLLNPW